MEKLSILYDGKCYFCHHEIQFYKRKDTNNLLELVDITADDFDASTFNVTKEEVDLHLHAFDESGNKFIGIDSFIEIWARIPEKKYQLPIKIFKNDVARVFLKCSYNIFAHYIRPALPKRKTCSI